jgi:hypothetical protein
MPQTLDEFVREAKMEIDRFEAWWRTKHEENPEHFPLQMEDGNEGLWREFLHDFGEDGAS